MEPVLILLGVAIGIARALLGRRQRSAVRTVARALRGAPTATDARFAREPRTGMFRR